MRRLLMWIFIAVVALGGFYVAWPAWTAVRIRQAIEANDPAALERKIDFQSVRERAKPLLAVEVERTVERLKERSGGLGAIAGQLRDRLGGRIADAAVDSILTPGNVVAMVRQGKSLRRVLRERVGERPATDTPQAPDGNQNGQPTGGQPDRPRRLGLANIKSYRITGPLSLSVAAALDQAATEPDVIVELAFTGGDWKVVGILPQF